ncbi:MAG TPA: glycogen debranching protein [Nocardioides sp.]|nr:glycogen debranching protein [Nocardioides sp.]
MTVGALGAADRGTAAAGEDPPAAALDVGRLPTSPELSETQRLADRRAVVIGERAYSTWTEDGLYPAMGFHTRGEMGGIWSPPIKLLDGLWFGVDGQWLGDDVDARRFSSGWGYTRTDYTGSDGVRVSRTDFVPDGPRAQVVGLTLRSDSDTTVPLEVAAHSELMATYPWGETTPSQLAVNADDTGSVDDSALVFREQAGADHPLGAHDWAAVVGSDLTPTSTELGPNHRGPQDPAVICPASGTPDPQPERCDDTAYGAGTGGVLRYDVPVTADKPVTVWFAVAGSDNGLADARASYDEALADPRALLADKVHARRAIDRRTQVDIPGDRRLERSIRWSKQNLADSVQESHDLRLRWVDAGKQFPEPVGTLPTARWLGAGWPDYPWIFGTDGEYTAFASVAMGQFDDIKAHLLTLRDVSEIINDGSGKVVHEVTPDGAVYFGANQDPGNTDETSKFPSAVALIWRWTGDDAFRDELYDFSKRGMEYVVEQLDEDGDGWPEGLGNVERPGMGEEKLDNTVYTVRGLRDLADMATSRGDTATATWASQIAASMEADFEQAWWYGGDARQYADSLANPDNTKVFQRHWIGVTPMDAMLVRPGQPTRPLADDDHGVTALEQRERECFTGEFGLYHTGTGPTSAPAGNPGASCDSVVSTVPSERSVFSLNTAIMAVAEGNFGRLGEDQQQHYTTGNARIQLDPDVWEMPGAMPEIAPEGDFTPNIDRLFTERSMVLQAWGAYGNLWPVVAQQLGVSPDLGRDRVRVVAQVPEGQKKVSGRRILLGEDGQVAVTARQSKKELRTEVRLARPGTRLTIGHVLPAGARVSSVRLDGKRVHAHVVRTARGRELVTTTHAGAHVLVIRLR